MLNFKFTVKHDNGQAIVRLQARSIGGAIARLCEAEKCPESAIIKIEISDVLPVLTAVRVEDKYGLFKTELYDEDGNLFFVYSAELDQPRKNTKVLVLNKSKYALKFK